MRPVTGRARTSALQPHPAASTSIVTTEPLALPTTPSGRSATWRVTAANRPAGMPAATHSRTAASRAASSSVVVSGAVATGASGTDVAVRSSLRIVTTADAVPSVAPLGLDSTTLKVSFGSTVRSPVMDTVVVIDVWPALNVRRRLVTAV